MPTFLFTAAKTTFAPVEEIVCDELNNEIWTQVKVQSAGHRFRGRQAVNLGSEDKILWDRRSSTAGRTADL